MDTRYVKLKLLSNEIYTDPDIPYDDLAESSMSLCGSDMLDLTPPSGKSSIKEYNFYVRYLENEITFYCTTENRCV